MSQIIEVSQNIDQLLAIVAMAQRDERSESYERLYVQVQTLRNMAREAYQAKLEVACRPIISKLEAGTALNVAEWDVVKLLVIGHAQYYVKYENDVEQWKQEIERLAYEVKKVQVSDVDDIDQLLHLKAACTDALKVLPDITYYFREKERAKTFLRNNGSFDEQTGRLLADFIRHKLASERL